jgi:protein-tyrosine phosphatase
MRILMVCLGNICRSPLAEGILAHKAKLNGLEWEVDSAGIGDWHTGQLPDIRSIKVAKKYGIDLTSQRARQVKRSDFQAFDLIFAMDPQNFADLTRLAKTEEETQKIRLLLDLTFPNENKGVPDPYFGDDAEFEHVFHLLDAACEKCVTSSNFLI